MSYEALRAPSGDDQGERDESAGGSTRAPDPILTPEKLLAIADWLDTFDAITELWLQGKLPPADTSDIEEALASVRSKDIQNELRALAGSALLEDVGGGQ